MVLCYGSPSKLMCVGYVLSYALDMPKLGVWGEDNLPLGALALRDEIVENRIKPVIIN